MLTHYRKIGNSQHKEVRKISCGKLYYWELPPIPSPFVCPVCRSRHNLRAWYTSKYDTLPITFSCSNPACFPRIGKAVY